MIIVISSFFLVPKQTRTKVVPKNISPFFGKAKGLNIEVTFVTFDALELKGISLEISIFIVLKSWKVQNSVGFKQKKTYKKKLNYKYDSDAL